MTRRRRFCWCAPVWLVLLVALPAFAQDPARPDSVPADTLQVPIPPGAVTSDTLPDKPGGAVEDTAAPPPVLAAFPDPGPTGWAVAEWVWDRQELLRVGGVTLVDLLMRVPGLTLTRAGGLGRPVAVAPLGLGGGRLHVFLNGYEWDPGTFSIVDLFEIGLVDLERVRLVRGLNEVRLELTSYRLDSREPYSLVEAASGSIQNTRVVRGLFARPAWGNNLVAGGFDLVDTRGTRRAESSTLAAGFARWTHAFSPSTGIRAEYRQNTVTREAAPFVQSTTRRSLTVTGRTRLSEHLTADAVVGRTTVDPDEGDVLNLRTETLQAVARAAWTGSAIWAIAQGRLRTDSGEGYRVPTAELRGEAGARPTPWLLTTGTLRFATTDGVGGLEAQATARAAPWGGVAAFATVATGTRALGFAADTTISLRRFVRDSADSVVRVDTVVKDTTLLAIRLTQATGQHLRAGAEWVRGSGVIGAAFLASTADRVVPFGFGFDLRRPVVEPDAATGVEAYASFPLFVESLRLDGWFTSWAQVGGRPYLPTRQWRAALRFHDLFYTGNLEPTVEVELLSRGFALVPGTTGTAFDALSEPYTLLNGFVQIRVLDVRVFAVLENLLTDSNAADLPTRPLGSRAVVGVRWSFRG